ncbi:MAG: indolepyruvate oxidoreductase subunit beta [Coriobacteriales bacterium]|nr:indolepyruvate oxidoreductase subunit beta [Coriobacteriales bacterium]
MADKINGATTVLLCGVGGQGTILAADILAKVAARAGLQIRLSEIHGMSQRGGSVITIVRFGQTVLSPVTDFGCADRIVAFEATEALRYLPYLAKDGKLLVNSEEIVPLPVLIGAVEMPENTLEFLEQRGAKLIDSTKIAEEVGNPKATNIVLMGALSTELDFPVEIWEEVISKRVPPKTIESNLAAFAAGAKAVSQE